MFKHFALVSLLVALSGTAVSIQAQETYPWDAGGSAKFGILPSLHSAGVGNLPDDPCTTQNGQDQPPPLTGSDLDWAYVDEKTGLLGILKAGKPSTPAAFDDVQPLAGRIYVARKKGCFGLVADDGRNILPFEFSSIALKTFDIDDGEEANGPAEVTLDAYRQEGHFLYRVDTKKGQLTTSAGPYQYVTGLDTPNQAASYAMFADKSPGPGGVIRRDLTIVVPAQYKELGWIGFAGDRRYWIGINNPTERTANTPKRAVWSVDLFDVNGRPMPPLRAYALWPLPFQLSGKSYGVVALLEDGTCAYFDRDWRPFERAESHNGQCGNADRMLRVVLSRNAQGHSVIWALVPVAAGMKQDTEVGQKALAHGDYTWKKGYEGLFHVVTVSGNEDFLVIQLDGSTGEPAFKLLDRHGTDIGGTYDAIKSVCGTIYLTRGTQSYKADIAIAGVVPVKAIPSIYCASF